MVREEIAAHIPLEDTYFFFRACVASNKYPGIETATKELLKVLGTELVESDEQTCCGGFIALASLTELPALLPAVARNLSIPEALGLHTLTLCNGCYMFLRELSRMLNYSTELKEDVNTILFAIGRKYNGTHQVLHLLEILYRLKKRIREKTVNPLRGLKFATHYGCHYLYGFKDTAIDDPFQPTLIEDMIKELGGEIVEYPEARACCGTGMSQIITQKEEIALPATKKKLDSLKEAQPDAVIVVCPYCLSQLDRMQLKFNTRGAGKYHLPVLYITQILAHAVGVKKEKLGFGAHCIPCDVF
jgi:heterodisulfide reductase subunit B